MSRVLVTGATGFLGRHLCPVLEAQGHEVTKVGSKDSFYTTNYDFIYHLAAYTQAGDWCLTHSGEQWIVNQKINTDVLTFWQQHSPNAKLITIGSSCAYAPGVNLTEDNYMKGEPHQSLYTYAMTKRMLYEGCRVLNKQYGMKYLYLVPSTLYGADYHRDGRQAHFIFDLIRKIIRGKELGERVVLWGDGSQLRDVVFIKDFIKVMLKLNEKEENDIFNVSGLMSRCTIRQFAKIICEIVGYPLQNITYDKSKHIGVSDKWLNTDKVSHAIADVDHLEDYQTPLCDAILNVVAWYYETAIWEKERIVL